MSLSIGIVGLPNAGKSTLFNALLKKQQALAANYPFATIEPNIGVVPVPDSRLEKLAEVIASGSRDPLTSLGMTKKPPIVPATVQFVDIAGLVAGAAKGEGLGNKFLAHIREVDMICHVMRSFSDPDVVHVTGAIDANKDKEIIETELIFADLQTLEKQVEPRGNATKEDIVRWKLITKLKEALDAGKKARDLIADSKEAALIQDLHLLTMKPVLYVKNVGESDISSQPAVLSSKKNEVIISAKVEAELAGLSEAEQKEYLQSLGLEGSGLERLITKAYDLLGLISFLTAGEKEVRAWTITKGMIAVDAAGVIHTDFSKKFIKAAVIPFKEFVELDGWKKAYDQGKVQLEGRDYVMKDGDVVDFKIGT